MPFTGGAKDLIYGTLGIVPVLSFDYWTRGRRFEEVVTERPVAARWAVYLFLVLGLLGMGVFDASQFIYFQF